MKTVLLTGGSGFIGSSICDQLAIKYNILKPSHKDLDLCDSNAVENFFIKYSPDIVIHSAAVGSKLDNRNNISTFYINMKMFENLQNYIPYLEKFINIDSGAIFGTDESIYRKSINHDYQPANEYGRSKLFIAKTILNYSNSINLRLFGCLGPLDHSNRFITTCISNSIKGVNTSVNNMYMDYFYVMDIPPVIEYCIENGTHQDIDLVYKSSGSITLQDIATNIYNLAPKTAGIPIVNNDRMPFYYCGNPDNLNSLNIKLDGLLNGIINTKTHHLRKWMF